MQSVIGGAYSGRRRLAAERFPRAGWHRLVKGEGAEECLVGHAGRDVLVVDGLAAWLSAALAEIPDDDALRETWLRLLDGLVAAPCEAVLILDEMGRGIVPMDPAARRLRDHNGWLAQAAVERSRTAWYMRHGLCKQLK
ncbi:bifunctional adenosylcobinamide kinase/adenosylcobinamide-phosphate guanylyltransferase [Halomonas sp. G15]|uniref:bifunctional adenosylcobinamide kinase/adenosylcobinamide-phosphate guanylyltransferase n=1 Tax=Halomonas sp. G15 TaxID=2903521 RepID=UPI001E37D0B1|nr:bifunctional adenosylcobinamide kinase/adenosylcobinamide-phosphate guanylyltransferase [Halomonas sp. G15]MCE0732194.1 bifunctional adenosylcobinamide kinase/adenosylcobinamide-phosphate guanylyltransferase [Halomonas sp. G15]